MNTREQRRSLKWFVCPQYLVEPQYIEGTFERMRTGSRSQVLLILRENDHRVRTDADFAGAGQPVGSFLLGFDIRGGMISKIWAIVVGITVKARFPQSGSRKTDDITIAILIRHINHHNNAVMWS